MDQSKLPQPNNFKQILGKKGEDIAREFLADKGYSFVEANFNCNSGEIDLIFTHRVSIIFVEVKTRTNLNFGHPEEAITRGKLSHLRKAAQIYLLRNPKYRDFSPQIDVVAVDMISAEVRHWEAVY